MNTKIDIQERMNFLQMEQGNLEALKAAKSIIARELPVALDKFYAQVRKTPDVSRLFSGEQHIAHAKTAQTGHWANIANADFNADYANKVRTIGTVHARIGLEPRWYIGGYAIVVDHLVRSVIAEELGKKSLFANKAKTAEQLGDTVSSLIKAVFLDMDLAISIYGEQAEADKKKAQETAIASERSLVSQSFGVALSHIAENDLTYRIEDDLPEAYEPLRDNFNQSIEQLQTMIGKIGDSASVIRASAQDLRLSADHCHNRTEQQAASIEETASALKQITATVAETSHRADVAQKLVDAAIDETGKSGAVLERTISAMGAIESSSSEIGKILGVIDTIAFQTNLLALNAGVEAARAGEAGRGFAVVAQEVRDLAQRSASAAREIKDLIASSGAKVAEGVLLVGETGKALQAIAAEVSDIKEHISSIVDSTREQNSALREINSAMGTLDSSTQQNAGMVQEATMATHSLAGEVDAIAGMLGVFKVQKQADNRVQSGRQHQAGLRSRAA